MELLFVLFCFVIFLLISIAFLTLAERKTMAAIQRREGPNVIGFLGLFQPFADGLKLFSKENILPINADTLLFFVSPIITFLLSLVIWAIVPINCDSIIADVELSFAFLMAVSSISIYGILISGWSSNSKYAFLGSLRSAAQLIAYEVSFSFTIVGIILCSGSASFLEILILQETLWFLIPLYPLAALFFLSSLAETNRHPFDLAEAEAELVSGYNVEYSSMEFALFFLGEYATVIALSAIGVILFLGGSFSIMFLDFFPISFWFGLKTSVVLFFFIVIRATIPRYRYDQLMRLGWKCLLPLSLSFVLLNASVLYSFGWLPN